MFATAVLLPNEELSSFINELDEVHNQVTTIIDLLNEKKDISSVYLEVTSKADNAIDEIDELLVKSPKNTKLLEIKNKILTLKKETCEKYDSIPDVNSIDQTIEKFLLEKSSLSRLKDTFIPFIESLIELPKSDKRINLLKKNGIFSFGKKSLEELSEKEIETLIKIYINAKKNVQEPTQDTDD